MKPSRSRKAADFRLSRTDPAIERAIADGRLSREEVDRAFGRSLARPGQPAALPPAAAAPKAAPRTAAAGPRFRSKTEARFALLLDAEKAAGRVKSWAHEGVTLRLADGARYTPDFYVVRSDGRLELVEVKGAYYREPSRVRYLVARDRFPEFAWTWAVWAKGSWTLKDAP